MKTAFVSQVRRFLEKNQRETQTAPCEQGEMGGGGTQEPEDKPPFLGEVEERRRREAVEEESSLDAERRKCTQPSTSFISATGTVDSEREEEVEPPGAQLPSLEVPDFLLSDAPEGNSGEHSICQMTLMAYVSVCGKIRRPW